MTEVLKLKPSQKAVKEYFADLAAYRAGGVEKETSVRSAIARLLDHCARKMGWIVEPEHPLSGKARNRSIDYAILTDYGFSIGYCEAKDDQDNLDREIEDKFEKHYPDNNTLFWQPSRAVIYQNGQRVFDESIVEPANLIAALEQLFAFSHREYRDWSGVVDEFKEVIPALGRKLVGLIEDARDTTPSFVTAFEEFSEVIREAVNPNLSDAALEEMLVQHILTERIFRNVFNNPDFVQRNAIAAEIEKVVTALTSSSFTKAEHMAPVERFYAQLEATAKTIQDFSEKQTFLNTIYERFFQGFSVKVADALGIVYTPQPIVAFMINSVDDILRKEFNLSLGSEGVHILDPFVGTGNFMVRLMRHLQPSELPRKYKTELHCNELMLLPYYIASLNIQYEYHEQTGLSDPFPGVCLVDTFGLAESRNLEMGFLTEENAQRVEEQRNADIMVIMGNPPYNAHQANENDNNKNRKYPTIDGRVRETYTKDSAATNKNALADPYVKAFRWASDRIRAKEDKRGIVAFVSNNSFLDNIAFDGMRKHLAEDFDKIYVLDLKGNARTSGERRRREAGNIFSDQIRVGISICFCVRNEGPTEKLATIHVHQVDDYLGSDGKKNFLNKAETYSNVPWETVTPTKKNVWLSDGLEDEFESFPPMGTREEKSRKQIGNETDLIQAIFKTYGRGVQTARDAWAYHFQADALKKNIQSMVKVYNLHRAAWAGEKAGFSPDLPQADLRRRLDELVDNDATRISWSRDLKLDLMRGHSVDFRAENIRNSIYRPFCASHLYFDRILNEEVYTFPSIFPTTPSEEENRVICVPGPGGRSENWCFATSLIPELHLTSIDAQQCFPFYSYEEDGSGRRENVTDWALARYRKKYGKGVSKWDIFHYVYGLLHHPAYRERYGANLRRSLPHIPEVADREAFHALAEAGAALMKLHVDYESQPRHRAVNEIWEDGKKDMRVEKMKWAKDKTAIAYNKALTLEGIPPEAHEYRLGNRSALEWVVDQYQVKTDKASGIVNDPNRKDDPAYIIALIGKVVTVSVETQRIVGALPALGLPSS